MNKDMNPGALLSNSSLFWRSIADDQNPIELVYINSNRNLNQDEVDRYSYSGLSVCVDGIDGIDIMQGRCALSVFKG